MIKTVTPKRTLWQDAVARRTRAIAGLGAAVAWLRREGVPFKIFAPRGFIAAHAAELAPLSREGVLFATPGGLDDHFLLAHADQHGSFVVSNDLFQDHVRDRGYDAGWLAYHRVPFMFDPDFAPAPDAVVRMREYARGAADPSVGPGLARPDPRSAAAAAPWGCGTRAQKKKTLSTARVDDDESSSTAAVVATGEEDDGACRRRVRPDAASSLPAGEPTSSSSLRVPATAVKHVIGRGGATVKAMEEAHGVRLRVEDRDSDEALVSAGGGTPEARAAALDDVRAIVDRVCGGGGTRTRDERRRPPRPAERDELAGDDAMDIDESASDHHHYTGGTPVVTTVVAAPPPEEPPPPPPPPMGAPVPLASR
mmetsp:Transcript_11410/g.46247  ORF Transcript_11410/g.46247 Transcript_11410/m.46247 type:complete len:367 (-) Transcript_11410:124-1224(-)